VLVDLAERRHPVALMSSPPTSSAQIDLQDRRNSSFGKKTPAGSDVLSVAVVVKRSERPRFVNDGEVM